MHTTKPYQYCISTVIFQDNLGSTSWTDKVYSQKKVKHIGISYHYVCDAVDIDHVWVIFTSPDNNRVEALTKILEKELYTAHMDQAVEK